MSRTSLVLLGVALALAWGAPRSASAHGVSAEVDQREGSVAVRARYDGGKPLVDAVYEVRSPRGGDAPFAQGRTDRHGWLAFTPDVPGRWTVRIADASGHGKTVEVEVGSVRPPSPAAAAGAPSTIALSPWGSRSGGSAPPDDGRSEGNTVGARLNAPRTLRVLAGVTAIVVVFRVLLAVQRARRGKVR